MLKIVLQVLLNTIDNIQWNKFYGNFLKTFFENLDILMKL